MLNDLSEIISSILNVENSNSRTGRLYKRITSGFQIRANLSIKVGLDQTLVKDWGPTSQYYDNRPIIDVFENDKEIKIVTLLPGIKQEDVIANIEPGYVKLEISKDGNILVKNIPCKVKPREVLVSSVTTNNSVLEILCCKVDFDEKRY